MKGCVTEQRNAQASEQEKLGFQVYFHQLIVVWPWKVLCKLTFPSCQIGIVILTLKDYGQDEMTSCMESPQPVV